MCGSSLLFQDVGLEVQPGWSAQEIFVETVPDRNIQ